MIDQRQHQLGQTPLDFFGVGVDARGQGMVELVQFRGHARQSVIRGRRQAGLGLITRNGRPKKDVGHVGSGAVMPNRLCISATRS